MTKKVRWGILSTANIGLKKVTPAIMKSPLSEVVAVASRDLGKAEEYIAELGLTGKAKAHGSYEALLADPNVDAIYNPLPNHLHVPMTLAAAKAGKHVLCEKPIALNAKEAEQLRQLPKDIVFYEAFMVRWHPQWQRAREIARSGELGELRAVRGVFTYYLTDPTNVRNQADIGGGGIYDIGCYPVTGSRFLFGAEPLRAVSLVDRDPVLKTDRLASVLLDFGGGKQASFVCSTQSVGHQSLELIGTKGRVELVVPFNAPADTATAIIIDNGYSPDGHLSRREIIPPCDQYTEQANAFCKAVLEGKPMEWGVEDAISSMKVLDAIFASEKSGGWATV
ncbi:Gfo/Idh/MocA family oxidoreductase [Devosia sp. ZB163]|uniref:Gfo/Idh/MocA family protein n=1 Tax=Devosia sp. ZB163 TaxID=3025938 RepID=UPI00235E2B84|nr:Gfo/Idh/MocA family oxidoreductase [Devosia sp. ZB163]MDC9822172.1 Gfo/Idh/MocA family oxidoreductase [Devosia sp. ZB163]